MQRRTLLFAAPAAVAGSMIVGLRAGATPANVVRFGQSASLTGGQATYGRDVRDGIAAAFAAASAQPGGPHFELVTLDDGGVRNRCAKNATTLIDMGVNALIGLTSGAGAEAC